MATTTTTPTPISATYQPSRPAFDGPYTNDDYYVKRKKLRKLLRKKSVGTGRAIITDPSPTPWNNDGD